MAEQKQKIVYCGICKTKIEKIWNYCPNCGGKIREDEYPPIRLNYLWERERSGQFIYDNFRVVRNTGVFALNKLSPVRERLGDFVHIDFYNLRKFALLRFSPKLALELFKIGKLTGYYDGELSISSTGLKKKRDKLSMTGKFLDILKIINERDKDNKVYFNLGCGILELTEINGKSNKVTYTLDENTNYSVKSRRKVCYEDLGVFCGMCEAVTNRFFGGVETKCHCTGDHNCEFEIYQTKKEEDPQIELITTDEANDILNNLVGDLVHRRHIVNRKTVGDYTYIAFEQCMNYLLTQSSKGHEVLSKYCGGKVGEIVVGEAGLEGVKDTLNYIKDFFEYMKVGLIEIKIRDETATILMQESAYSSGANNIKMKLDAFIAGIIEGALTQATNQKWQVEETKCLANGNDHCEFVCKAR